MKLTIEDFKNAKKMESYTELEEKREDLPDGIYFDKSAKYYYLVSENLGYLHGLFGPITGTDGNIVFNPHEFFKNAELPSENAESDLKSPEIVAGLSKLMSSGFDADAIVKLRREGLI